jgi:hypothetical protein
VPLDADAEAAAQEAGSSGLLLGALWARAISDAPTTVVPLLPIDDMELKSGLLPATPLDVTGESSSEVKRLLPLLS